MWYIILFDSDGTGTPVIDEYDHEPTEQEQHDAAQAVGYLYAGCYQSESRDQALAMADTTFDGSGCVA